MTYRQHREQSKQYSGAGENGLLTNFSQLRNYFTCIPGTKRVQKQTPQYTHTHTHTQLIFTKCAKEI